jgi:nitrite reductase/ring-hydroxylating ferredoxin subunit
MVSSLSQEDKISRGAEDSCRYFRYMAEYVGFGEAEVEAIRESRYIIEKYIPEVVSKFYAQLLRYPPTRKYFLRKDGSLDQDYLQLRMKHLGNFWRRTASGVYDDDYARYVDYVGRGHTSRGADPNIYIPDRYVIGQVGFMQNAIIEAISKELHEIDPDWEVRALRAWNLLMMVILEMLSRAYGYERDEETYAGRATVDGDAVLQLSVEAYELALGMRTSQVPEEFLAGLEAEIPEGERKIVEIEGRSIGVFHHDGRWYAVQNSCLHRGGPVATGTLKGDVLTCPWHGYQYNLTSGELLADPKAKLEQYPVEVREGEVFLKIPTIQRDAIEISILDPQASSAAPAVKAVLQANEFDPAGLTPGQATLVHVGKEPVAVFNVGGQYYATQDTCTHAGGPLSEGELDEKMVTCPWHGSCFDVTDGSVLCGPARKPLKTFRVSLEGEVGRVESV